MQVSPMFFVIPDLGFFTHLVSLPITTGNVSYHAFQADQTNIMSRPWSTVGQIWFSKWGKKARKRSLQVVRGWVPENQHVASSTTAVCIHGCVSVT